MSFQRPITGAFRRTESSKALRLRLDQMPGFIINLDRSPGRWLRSFRSLARLLPPDHLTRVAAVDGRAFAGSGPSGWQPDLLRHLQGEGLIASNPVPDPVRSALCLSHQRALRTFLKKVDSGTAPRHRRAGRYWALIFEDDVVPGEALVPLLDVGLEVPADADIVFLHDRVWSRGGDAPRPAATRQAAGAVRWRKVRGGIGLEALLVSDVGARKMLAGFRPLVMECDLQLMTFMEGYQDGARRQAVWAALRANGHSGFRTINAWAPARPLFQTDHFTASDKFAAVDDVRVSALQPGGLVHEAPRSGTLKLNPAAGLGLAAVWFNPARYASRLENLKRFMEGMAPWHDRLVLIELAFDDEDWQVPDDLPNLVRLRSKAVCWQKEALINHAFQRLDEAGFKHFGWLDADIVFDDPGWYEKVLKVLHRRNLCQVFERVRTCFPDQGEVVSRGAAAHWWHSGSEPLKHAVTGFGWAMRREVWQAARLLDTCIVGGGDYAMWHATFHRYLSPRKVFWNQACSKGFRRTRAEWAARWSRAIAMEVGFASGVTVTSLPHGRLTDRHYQSRSTILQQHVFDPEIHLRRDAYGLLQWTEAAPPGLMEGVKRYFFKRREDTARR